MGRAPIVEKYWYSIDWEVEAIWALDLPVIVMDVAHFQWIMDVPIWPFEGKDYQVTPHQVMAEPARYAKEYERVLDASLDYPLDIIFNQDRWMILDGVHRLTKAILQGSQTVNVRIIPDEEVRLRV